MSESLSRALKVTPKNEETCEGARVYDGLVSRSWGSEGVTHGGYAIGIVLSAANQFQSSVSHSDPLHLTAHYLQPVQPGPCTIKLKRTRQGKEQSHLDAELLQNGVPKIIARMVYGVLPDLSQVFLSDKLTLVSPNPIARRIPLSCHPSIARLDKPDPKLLFQDKSEDMFFKDRNVQRMAKRNVEGSIEVEVDSLGSGTFEWAAWFQLKNEEDEIDLTMLPFFADCMKNVPSLLPRGQRPGPSWFATIVLTVDFNSKIPSVGNTTSVSSTFAPRTLGIYSMGRFITEGRHDQYVELWTSPSPIGSGSDEFDAGWREKQICLATSTQMAVTIPQSGSSRKKSSRL